MKCIQNEETAIRRCYASMSHESGDVLRPRDCVLLKSGTRKGDLPYVAKIAALWENPDDGRYLISRKYDLSKPNKLIFRCSVLVR